MNQLGENYARVRTRMVAAAQRAGRDPNMVQLAAISKGRSLAQINALAAAGQRIFGENRIPEGSEKVQASRESIDPQGQLSWHFVGHIQRRKAKAVAANFALVHSIDRLAAAEYVSREASELGQTVAVLLECNISGEASKSGFDGANWQTDPQRLAALESEIAAVLALPGLNVAGLMTMAPIVDDPEATRPIFRGLRQLRDHLAERFAHADWQQLSMGMTDDFEVAIEEGATLVRVGRALFETEH